MRNENYWANRIKIAQDKTLDRIYDEYVANIEKQYDRAICDIEKDILAWYQRFADNNELSFADAQKLLKTDELEEFKWTVQEYIEKGKENGISADWAKELENASARVHISRLESLKYQLRAHAEELTQGRIKNTTEASELAFTEGYYHTAYEFQKEIGVGFSLQSIDRVKLEKILNTPWTTDNQTFTARCWTDKAKLVEAVNQELTRMVATGASPKKAIENISKQFGTSKTNAGRVIVTESAYFATASQGECYKDLNVENYEVIETLDSHTCSFCGEMDGKVFPVNKMQAGSTAPPFHPWCRGTTAPYYEDMVGVGQRFARDIETGKAYYLPSDTTYEQWRAMQDAKYGEGSVDKARKKAYNESKDREQFERYKNVLKELSPKGFKEFQNVKYGEPKQWETLKYQYRTVNRYEVDGEVSAGTILELDNAAWYTKQKGFDYSAYTGKIKSRIKNLSRCGNAASMKFDSDIYFAHSRISDLNSIEYRAYKGEYPIVGLQNERVFEVLDLGDDIPRENDTEAKFLEYVATIKRPKDTFKITILSEKHICKSCQHVVSQFKQKYPNATVNIVSGKRNYNNSEDGLNTWSHRKKVK
ncbi:MAG: minor capsid protein [Clostridia bacterium]|nr:minor capsid protein [Clostridia bacterium]